MASLQSRAMFLAVAAFSAGCITFEQQTVSYRHDPGRDVLLVQIVYSGIHGDATHESGVGVTTPGLTEVEQADLVEAVRGNQIYLFDSWLPVFDLDALCLELAERAYGAPDEAELARREFWRLLAANVRISNGPFYLDGQGRLSAVQHIRITNLGAVVRSANRFWAVETEALLMEAPEWEPAARIDQPVQFVGNQLILRYPAGEEVPGQRRWLDAGVLKVADGVATLTLGSPTASRVTFVTPSAGRYVGNAVEFVRQHFGLDAGFDPKADADALFGWTRR